MSGGQGALGTPALEVRGLSLRLGAAEVLADLDLSVASGSRCALVGPNGAGKSSLLHVLSGVYAPSAGEVFLAGARVTHCSVAQRVRAGLRRSFQKSALFWGLTVRQNVQIAVGNVGNVGKDGNSGNSSKDAGQRVDVLLADLGLAQDAQSVARTLSYAKQRVLELGLAVAGPFSVLLLDEPTAGLSAAEREHMVALIKRLTQGKTLVLVEHDAQAMDALVDRVVELRQGRLLQEYAA